jgi:hypothetical protein
MCEEWEPPSLLLSDSESSFGRSAFVFPWHCRGTDSFTHSFKSKCSIH